MSTNGSDQSIPEDIKWDELNPPVLFVCSNHTFHMPACDGSCGYIKVTENRVKLINEGLAFARAGMNWRGIPSAYESAIPVPGVRVELTDVLVWLEQIRDMVCELSGVTLDEFDDKFAGRKFSLLHNIRMQSEAAIRKQRTVDMFGVQLYGPDGRPFNK